MRPAEAVSRSDAPGEKGGCVRRALVVEDEAGVRGLMALLLTLDGFEVTEESSLPRAERLLDPGYRYDLIVTDYHLREGPPCTLSARARRLHPGVRVILTSGIRASELNCACSPHCYSSFLPKPFTIESFRTAIREEFEHD
ncbi:MAG: response regulator [Candidatus Solibacter usitatus]|nr:response regulator [Candidatus Solibacter usitatus]